MKVFNDFYNIHKGQILYVLFPDNISIKPVKVIETNFHNQKEPYIITKYFDSRTNGTVTFYPNDLNMIIFKSKKDAGDKARQNDSQTYHDKYLLLYKRNSEIIRNTIHPEIKYLCSIERQKLRQIWEEFGFNLKELDDLEQCKNNIVEDLEK